MNDYFTPSLEVKALIKDWCAMQLEKYGPDWKTILAKEMAEDVPTELKAAFQAQFLTRFESRPKDLR